MESFKLNPRPSHIYIIGAGGVISHLLPSLLLTLRSCNGPAVTIIDGDKLEKRNLNRQLFSLSDIGKFKAESLMRTVEHLHPIRPVNNYFTDSFEIEKESFIFVGVDNHPARRSALFATDRCQGWCIIGANEYTDEEAYFYSSQWYKSPLDPRVYYPELLTGHADDPTAPCTGEAQVATPQLVVANQGAAFYMHKLFWFWFMEAHKLDKESQPFQPIRFSSNFSRIMTTRRADYQNKEVA